MLTDEETEIKSLSDLFKFTQLVNIREGIRTQHCITYSFFGFDLNL